MAPNRMGWSSGTQPGVGRPWPMEWDGAAGLSQEQSWGWDAAVPVPTRLILEKGDVSQRRGWCFGRVPLLSVTCSSTAAFPPPVGRRAAASASSSSLLLPAAGDGLMGRQTDGRASLREEQCREKRPVMAQGRKVPDKRGIVSGAKRKQMPAGAGAFQSTPRALGAAAGTRQGGGGHNKWQSPFPVGSGSCFSSAEHKEPRCKAAVPQRCARMGLSPRSRAHRGSAAEGLLPPPHEAQPRSTPVAPTRPINAPQRTGQLRGCTRSATELTFGDGYLRNLPPPPRAAPQHRILLSRSGWGHLGSSTAGGPRRVNLSSLPH